MVEKIRDSNEVLIKKEILEAKDDIVMEISIASKIFNDTRFITKYYQIDQH